MDRKCTLDDFDIETLSDETDLSTFDCSNGDESGVNDFFHNEAKTYSKEHMGVTYIFREKTSGKILGCVTASMTSVRIGQCPDAETLTWFSDKQPPAVLIGQVGCDNSCRGKNVGVEMCNFIIGLAVEMSKDIGCRYIALQAKQRLIKYYEKMFFQTTNPRKRDVFMVRRIID